MWAPEAARRATSPLGAHGCRYGGDAVRMRLTSGSPQRAEAPLGGSEGASGASVEPVRWRGRRLRLSKYYGDRGPTDCMSSLPDDVNGLWARQVSLGVRRIGHHACVLTGHASPRRHTTCRLKAVAVAGLVCVSVAVGGSAFAESKPTTAATRTLKATAIANATAWLTGTADDIKRYQGPECASTKQREPSAAEEAAALDKLRAPWVKRMGRPLKTIKIQGARVRNVTAVSGEAEVEYDLPSAVVGNYNWVTFERHDGKWKVADCRLPFSGNSQSALPAT